jgi:HEXXH motif-containing protein
MTTHVSLTGPNGPRAAAVRQEFSEAVCNDWIKLLEFATREGIIDPHAQGMLATAVEQARAVPNSLGSEFFYSYFRCLESLRGSDRHAAAGTALALGNVLLPQLATGNVSTPIPVLCAADGLVALPSAAPSAALRVDGPVVGPQDIDRFQEQITRAQKASWYARIAGWGVRGHTAPIDAEVSKYEERISKIAGEPAGLAVLDREPAQPIVRGLTAAATLLRDVAPEVAGEIAAVTEYVVPLRGDHFVGGSDIYLYGASFLRLESGWTPLCFADHLVHEAAHQLMHAEHELRPLLLNRDYVGAPSPIRTDPRPLYGTFHATFVFARLASFMDAFLARHPGSAEAELRLHRHLLGLLQGLHILEEHGALSNLGDQEMESWRELAAKLVARHGMPQPGLYLQLTWDYDEANSSLPVFRP